MVHEMPALPAVIGRGAECHVRILSPFVSRIHARLADTPSGFELEAFATKNGTWINGERVNGSAPVRHRDELSLGPCKLLFWDSTSGEDTLTAELSHQPRDVRQAIWVGMDSLAHASRLSALEGRCLAILSTYFPSAVSTTELGDALWGQHCYDPNMVYQVVRRTRKRLASLGSSRMIMSAPSGGYVLAGEEWNPTESRP